MFYLPNFKLYVTTGIFVCFCIEIYVMFHIYIVCDGMAVSCLWGYIPQIKQMSRTAYLVTVLYGRGLFFCFSSTKL